MQADSSKSQKSPSSHQSDAQALLELLKHQDKEVRKAARKALHKLRSRGIQIADTNEDHRTWSQTSLDTLRGTLQAFVAVDTKSVPSLATFIVSLPLEDGYCQLWIVSLTAQEQIYRFENKFQTDGQRNRLLRSWQEKYSLDKRQIPLSWLFERILWARRTMMSRSQSVPKGVEQNLTRMSEVAEPTNRPANFLHEKLSSEQKISPAAFAEIEQQELEKLLQEVGSFGWPAFFDLQNYAEHMNQIQEKITSEASEIPASNQQQNESEPERQKQMARAQKIGEEMVQYLRTSEEAKSVLQGPVTTILEDAAMECWLHERDRDAAILLAMTEQLRLATDPASFAWLKSFFEQQQVAVVQTILQSSRMNPFRG